MSHCLWATVICAEIPQGRARNQYDKVSNIESFSFRILPPFYRTRWAYLLYLVVLIFFVYGMVRLNEKRIKQKNRELERKVEEKTIELKISHEMVVEQNMEIAEQAKVLQDLNTTKDKLFSIISHDLRGPIGIILSTIDIMKGGGLSEQEVRSFIAELGDHMMVTGHLLNNLLFCAKARMEGIRSMPSVFDVKDGVEENCRLFRALADGKNVRLVRKTDSSLWVFADKDIVTMVLRNLINNAIKFTKQGGEVIIGGKTEKGHVELFVQDTGTGLSRDDIAKILNKQSFHRQDTSGQFGSGLGLMLCQELIEKDGGKITIESRSGEGSRFSFKVNVFKDEDNGKKSL